MNTALVSALLGVFVLMVHVAALKEGIISMFPPGPQTYVGDYVLLRCRVKINATFEWTYRWNRDAAHAAPSSSPRHQVSGDSYSIMAVTREDAGRYSCRAEQRGSSTATAMQVTLNVSETIPPPIKLTPSNSQIFVGQSLTVQCPPSQRNSSGWQMAHFSPRLSSYQKPSCSPSAGGVSERTSDVCVFVASLTSSGLYWCEGAEGRSGAVYLAVRDGDLLLKTTVSPVHSADKEKNSHGNSTSDDEIEITKSDGARWWMWVIFSVCVLVLFLIGFGLFKHSDRYRACCRQTWSPLSTNGAQAVPLPATKQDVTEVQWDLSWMEMSNLLDKNVYPTT